jgi:hypothetical protein
LLPPLVLPESWELYSLGDVEGTSGSQFVRHKVCLLFPNV